jgi:hypothetical protein
MTSDNRVPRRCQRESPNLGNVLAYATFNVKPLGLGEHGPQARQEFEEFLAAWLVNGRQLPEDVDERGYRIVVRGHPAHGSRLEFLDLVSTIVAAPMGSSRGALGLVRRWTHLATEEVVEVHE